MALLIKKFGGTSVGDIKKIQTIAQNIRQSKDAGNDIVIVVSAMGSTTDKLNHLAVWMIECPYCRKSQNGILPYTKMPGVRRIKGVNSPKEWSLITKNCKECNKPCIDLYCSKTCERINNKCNCLIKPKYKGQPSRQCHNKCIQIVQNGDESIKLCGIHYNQYTKKGISALNLLKK